MVCTVSRFLATVKNFDPVSFFGGIWKVIEEETDKRAEALNEVDFNKINFETCLKPGEDKIIGEEKLKRLREGGNILLGAETFLAFWQEKEHATLEWLHKEKGVTYIYFFGTILEGPCHDRYVLYLYCFDGQWDWDYYWLGFSWGDRDFSVSLTSN